MDGYKKPCPFCNYEARTDALRRHIKSVHPYDSVLNKRNPLSQNYFFQLPGDERKILVSYKGGAEDIPDTRSAFNMYCCFECYTWVQTGYCPLRTKFNDFCSSHKCKARKSRAKRTEKPKTTATAASVDAPRTDPFEETLALILDRSEFRQYSDVITLFYSPANTEEDEPATTGLQYQLDMHKYFKKVNKELSNAQQKAATEFWAERGELMEEVKTLESQLGCLRTELQKQKELTNSANQQLCLKAAEYQRETARLEKLLRGHNITF